METSSGRAAALRHARRVSGQVGALQTMIATGRPITDLTQQVVAARGSLDALLIRLIVLELDECSPGEDGRPAVDRLVRLALGKHVRRGATPHSSPGT